MVLSLLFIKLSDGLYLLWSGNSKKKQGMFFALSLPVPTPLAALGTLKALKGGTGYEYT